MCGCALRVRPIRRTGNPNAVPHVLWAIERGFSMTEERITETEGSAGETHTTHTIITDREEPRRSGGGAGWMILMVLVIVAVAGFFLFSNMSDSEVAKNNAVAEAANQVGDAAQNVGDAVKDATDPAK